MKFTVLINCEGFADYNAEVSRILRELAARVRDGEIAKDGRTQYHTLRDHNGNSVGGATYDRTGEPGYPPERLPKGHWRYTR